MQDTIYVPAQDTLYIAATFGERLRYSFEQIYRYVPALIGAFVIVFAGYLLARLLERATERLLRKIHFNRLLERGGVLQAVERGGTHFNPTRVLATIVFWSSMFVVLLIAANALGLEQLANVFSDLVSYIPSVIAAIAIIIVGMVLGGFVGGLILAGAGGMHGGPTLARVGKAGVIILAVFMALQELGIAGGIVTTAFALLFGAIALALGLSFGLGNRDLAGQITREWYERYRAEQEAIDREHEAMDREDEEYTHQYPARRELGDETGG
jgi:MFS family permease